MDHNHPSHPQYSSGANDARAFYQRLEQLGSTGNPRLNCTNIIIALNIIAFIIMGFLGAGWFMPEDMLVYIKYGANNGGATTNGEWWRLLTSMFMHYGIIHLAVNMWAIRDAGAFFEKLQGRFIYILTYIACGVSGGFASILWNGDKTWSAGASGAIFGVFGAILGYMLRERQTLPASVYKPIIKSTASFAVYNIIFGFIVPGIDNSAHIGGLLCGIVFGFVLARPLNIELRRRRATGTTLLGIALFAALIYGGISLTPRFTYAATDELAWETDVEPILQKFDKLNDSTLDAILTYNKTHDAHALSKWIQSNIIPFCKSSADTIDPMSFTPGLITAKRKELLISMLREYQKNWMDFSAALDGPNTTNLNQYISRSSQLANSYAAASAKLRREKLP